MPKPDRALPWSDEDLERMTTAEAMQAGAEDAAVEWRKQRDLPDLLDAEPEQPE